MPAATQASCFTPAKIGASAAMASSASEMSGKAFAQEEPSRAPAPPFFT